ncbi:MAG: tetratricopeptide repeat protein [Phormidesmis sp.]
MTALDSLPITRTAKMLLLEGIAAARRHDRVRAIALLTQSIALQSDDSTIQLKAYYHRGCALSAIGQCEGAIADFSQVIQFSSAHSAALVPDAKLTEIYIHRGNAYRRLGCYSLALADLNRGVERSGSAQSYGARGLLRLDTDEYEQAIADFTSALSIHPTFAQCHLWLGFAQLSSGAYQQAVEPLSRAIEAISTCAEAYNHRGVARFYLNEFAAASADFDQAIRLNQTFAEGYYNRGNLRQLRGEFAAAKADHRRASLLDPRLFEHKKQVANLSPNRVAFYRHRAIAHFNQGHLLEAIADYTQALAIFPTAYAHYHRGRAYVALNEFDRAHLDFDAAIALSPDYGAVYGDRAWLRLKAGDWVGAIADTDQALALTANLQPLKDIYATRCLALFCLQQPKQALQSFEQMIESIAKRIDSK